MYRQLVDVFQVDETDDLVNLVKHVEDLHRRIAGYKQRIVVEIYVEEIEIAAAYSNEHQKGR